MPFLGLGLHVGDADADSIIGSSGGGIAPPPPPPSDGLLKLEDDSGVYLTESGDYLAFELPPLWTPSNTSSTVGWWDASDASTISTSGSEVQSVTDKSGNGYTLQRGTTGPTIGTRTLNGLNVFEFAGANYNTLENNSFAWDQANNALGFAAIYRLDDDGLTEQDFLLSGTNSSTRIGVRRLTDQRWQILVTGGSITTTSALGTEPVTQMMVARFNAGSSFIRIDGVQDAVGTIGSVAFSKINISGNYLEQQGVEGFIAEMVFFSDLTETQKIEGYLAHKWGIDGNLDSSHPYAFAAPTI